MGRRPARISPAVDKFFGVNCADMAQVYLTPPQDLILRPFYPHLARRLMGQELAIFLARVFPIRFPSRDKSAEPKLRISIRLVWLGRQ
jgi:hypothetical protein